MRRLIPLLLLFISTVSLAESGAYRVEIIVFRNLEVVAEPGKVEDLRSYSHFPDLKVTRETETTLDESTDNIPGDLAELLRDDLPDDLTVMTSKGTYMDDVWRHLRSSKGYRPLLYSAWQQNQVDYNPPMRIHDQNIIDTQLRPPSELIVADLTASDPLAEYRSNFYQLDGSVQLRRSRFLHVYIDLEYREKPARVISETNFFAAAESPKNINDMIAPDTGYDVHSLKQNKPVRTGQLQYFDTPFLGVLVFVSTIAVE
jgi:hypothetical protein